MEPQTAEFPEPGDSAESMGTEAIRSLFQEPIQGLISTLLLDHLYARNLLTGDEVRELQGNSSLHKRSQRLLAILISSPSQNEIFAKTCNTLRSIQSQEPLATLIDQGPLLSTIIRAGPETKLELDTKRAQIFICTGDRPAVETAKIQLYSMFHNKFDIPPARVKVFNQCEPPDGSKGIPFVLTDFIEVTVVMGGINESQFQTQMQSVFHTFFDVTSDQ